MSWDFLFPRRRQKRRIAELTEYLEKVNTNTAGCIVYTTEDEFSHLQDEIYKTVTSLHKTREDALLAKANYAENLANIAHQLKTPITAISISLQLMEKQQSMEKRQSMEEQYMKQIKKQLDRLSTLEESLLLLSRLDNGTLPMKNEAVDLYTVLNLASDNLDTLLAERNIAVEIREQGCVRIEGDLEWTMEAFMNLIKNCAEHAPANSQVHCTYEKNPLYTEILIWDEGNGFKEEDLPHLFERFYRGNSSKGTGIGIGLSIARAILELENGYITAKNRNEGGACFEIRIYDKVCH